MLPIRVSALLLCFVTCLSFTEASAKETGFPGDVISFELNKVSAMAPMVRFGLSELAVVDAGKHWQALLGLDLDQLPGEYIIYTQQTDTDEPAAFIAFEVLNRDYETINGSNLSKNADLPDVLIVEELSVLDFTNSQPPSLPFIYPLDSQWHDNFGARTTALSNTSNSSASRQNFIHTLAPVRSLVRAPQRGIVSNILQSTANTFTVVIDHGQQVFSILHGIDELTVEVGNGIEENAVIAKVPVGKVGAPNNTIAWQVSMNGVLVNPVSLTNLNLD